MTRRPTITEREVRRAKRDGATTLDVAGAVVTPSARDVARTLGVSLTGAPEASGAFDAAGSRSGAAARERHAPPRAAPKPATGPKGKVFPATPPSVALGADHGGVALKDAIAARLRELKHPVSDLGTTGSAPVDYPDFAVAVARAVAEGRAVCGIMVDGAGIGSCMAANKVRGVRAAMCYDVTTAQNAREHNNANVLTLGGGLIGTRLALAIVETFLSTPFAAGRHEPRVAKIDELDRRD